MRVALINPRFRLPIDTRTTPHLGLAYLGAVSQRRGDEVRIFDMDVEDQPLGDFLKEFNPQLVGIKSRSDYHSVPFNAPEYLRILRAAERRGLPMLHHTFGVDVARQMAAVIGSLGMNFIIAHSGGGSWRTVVPILAEFPNAYFDLCASIIDSDKTRTIASIVGVERLIFGSDMNLISPFWTIGMFESAGFSEAELRLMYWETPKRVLGLSLE